MRLTEKIELFNGIRTYRKVSSISQREMAIKLGQHEDFEEKLGIDLVTFLKGVKPSSYDCFMEITKDKKFDFCGDAYYGTYSKEGLLKLIQELLFMYWALTKEELCG